MALTGLQREICRLLAENRIASGESYVAGGVALNELLEASRVSRDIDLFHDTEEALDSSWRDDRTLLVRHGYGVVVIRERAGLVEAEIVKGDERVRLEWARDSAYRFFPLVRHDDFGLVLHPFDLATNKVLALVGRLEVRDWVDVIECHERLQPLGCLAWAACGKDPGFSPSAILEHAARSSRHSVDEVNQLAFLGDPPDAADLGKRWHAALASAREIVAALPPAEIGRCVLDRSGGLYRGTALDVPDAVRGGRIRFHRGRIRGALPELKGTDPS